MNGFVVIFSVFLHSVIVHYSFRHGMLSGHQIKNMDESATKLKTPATFSHTVDAGLDCGGVSAAISRQSDSRLQNPLCPLCTSQMEVKKKRRN